MSKERQLRKQEEIRNIILDAAREIIAREGVQGLTIRKITRAIDYSPGIIYHYFKDKNEILESLFAERQKTVFAAINSVARNEEEPEKEIEEMFKSYMKLTLASPELYKAIMFNDDPSLVEKTVILEKGIIHQNKLMQLLASQIQKGINQGRFTSYDAELTAQIIWTSTFGLLVKLIIEKKLPEEQINRLIDHHFTVIFNGVKF